MSFKISADQVPISVRLHLENLEEILILHKKIKTFLNDSIALELYSDNTDKLCKGLYLKAFCVGAHSVLLSVNETINKIQDYIDKSSGSISFLFILNESEFLNSVLASIKYAISMIESGKFNGCKLLDLCDSFITSGLPMAKLVFIKIQKFCLKVLFLQSKLWIMQAILHDPYNEFFIKPVKNLSLSQETLMNTVPTSVSFYSLMNTNMNLISCTMSNNSIYPTFCEAIKHEINGDNLPALVPFSVASQMLFIGEAFIMCQGNGGNKNIKLLEDCGICEDDVISCFNEMENSEEFTLKDFSNLINNLWIKINKQILKISKEVGNVSSKLSLFSDIFFLGRGDLFHEFLLKASHLLNVDATSISSRSLNMALKEAINSVCLPDILEIIDNFHFVLPNRKLLKPGIKIIGVISLQCNIKWPLHFLFTWEVMKSYNKLFRFLLSLKKAQVVLSFGCQNFNSIIDYSLRNEIIQVKMHLLSIVVNLQNYCFNNVITHEMNVLLSSISNTELFTELQKIHSSFLINVSNRLFVSNFSPASDGSIESTNTEPLEEINKKVHKCFLKIFVLCDLFADLFEHSFDENLSSKVSSIKIDLDKVLRVLFALLKKTDQNCWYDDNGSAGHLFNLIMFLDFNRFYQRKFELNFDD